MARRLKALFMLVLFGLVLPIGAAPQRFCTKNFTLAAIRDTCAACQEKSCCKKHSQSSGEPDCVIVTQQLPDGVHSDSSVSLPPLVALPLPEPFLPAFVAIAPLEIPAGAIRERAPPDRRPLYLTHRSLLL